MKKYSEALKIALFISLGLGLAWYSLRDIPLQVLFENFKKIDPFWTVVVIFISLASHVARALRWNILLEPSGHKIKPVNAIMAVLVGYFVNLALPRTGEIARCGIASKYDNVPVSTGFGTVVLERIIDVILLMVCFAISLVVGFDKLRAYLFEKIINPIGEIIPLSYLAGIGFVGLLAGGIVLFYLRSVKKKNATEGKKGILAGFIEGLQSITEIKRPFQFIAYSLAIWVCYYLMLFFGFLAYPATESLGLDACLAVFVFGTVGMAVTPGGIGAYPALVGQTLVLYGLSEVDGISFGWIIWGIQTLEMILLGVLSLVALPLLNRPKNETENEGTSVA